MNLSLDDGCYILTAKFFLYYLFNERNLLIKPTLNESNCVICTKGRRSRINELKRLLDRDGNADQKHEIEALITYLNNDDRNDTTIIIFGSTIVYNSKDHPSSEFDGIIIYPNRDADQVVLFEAKNTVERPGYGKKCLKNKLDNLGIVYDYEDIVVFNHDAYFKMTI